MRRVEDLGYAFIVYGTGGGRKGEFIQTDYDFPGAARSLGWNLRRVQVRRNPDSDSILDMDAFETVHLKRAPNSGHGCAHFGTDGTMDCPGCGITASDFIGAASEYLSWKATRA